MPLGVLVAFAPKDEAACRSVSMRYGLSHGGYVLCVSTMEPRKNIVLGATGKNEELDFEAQGITLAQALARAGGLQDSRANARGVFVFRFEDPSAFGLPTDAKLATTPDGKIPVIYKVDLKDPATFFVAQGFPMRDKDVMYVSNAPAAELQKFLNIVGSVVAPVAAARVLSQ